MHNDGQITINELVKRVKASEETKKNLPKREQISFELLMEKIEQCEKLMEEGLEYVKENRQEEWKKEVTTSYTNEFLGEDMKCALTIMKGIERGLKTRDALYLSEHHFGIPAQRIIDLLYKYSNKGEKFYKESSNLQRLAYYKERAVFLDTYTNPKKLVKKRDV